ncbi:MAG: TolC family protein [Myxococcota bacterium]|nr:TolC family protein [Myxococcota bacterium]
MYLILTASALAGPLNWESLPEQSLDAWGAGPGGAASVQLEWMDTATRRALPGPDSLRAEVQAGDPANEQQLLALSMPLSLGIYERQLWAHAEAAIAQDAQAARWAWVAQAEQAYGAWWLEASLLGHLRELIAEGSAQLDRLEQAAQAGLVSPATLDDMRAALATRKTELAQVERAELAARGTLRTYFPDAELDLSLGSLPEANPWPALQPQIPDFPQLRQHQAAASQARAQAHLAQSQRLPTLSVGPMRAGDTSFLYAELSLPLDSGAGSERAAAMGVAQAEERRSDWTRTQLEAELALEAERYAALLSQRARFEGEVLTPLRARQARLEAGLEAGLVPLERALRGRQDWHEAEHAWLALQAELQSSALSATTFALLLEES